MVVLLCVAALLPDRPTSGEPSDALASVDSSCNRLLGVALVVSAPLQVLHDALSQGGGAGGGARPQPPPWREFIKSHGKLAVATGSWVDVKVPYLLRPLHHSQYGLLLEVSIKGKVFSGILTEHCDQLLLSEGGKVCLELCLWRDETAVMADVLNLLALCPHSSWALAAVCKGLVSSKHAGRER